MLLLPCFTTNLVHLPLLYLRLLEAARVQLDTKLPCSGAFPIAEAWKQSIARCGILIASP
jgi:hypothetical protein